MRWSRRRRRASPWRQRRRVRSRAPPGSRECAAGIRSSRRAADAGSSRRLRRRGARTAPCLSAAKYALSSTSVTSAAVTKPSPSTEKPPAKAGAGPVEIERANRDRLIGDVAVAHHDGARAERSDRAPRAREGDGGARLLRGHVELIGRGARRHHDEAQLRRGVSAGPRREQREHSITRGHPRAGHARRAAEGAARCRDAAAGRMVAMRLAPSSLKTMTLAFGPRAAT